MEAMPTDLRKWKCGGWEASKMNVKINGRWSYIYENTRPSPTNVREPITYDQDYSPPNHQHEKMSHYPMQKMHPTRAIYMQNHLHPKAPIQYQEASYLPHPAPPVWINKPDPIKDIRYWTAQSARRQAKEKKYREKMFASTQPVKFNNGDLAVDLQPTESPPSPQSFAQTENILPRRPYTHMGVRKYVSRNENIVSKD